jgi:hypothetical protein
VQLSQYRGQWDKLKRDQGGGHFDLVAALSIACWAYVKRGMDRKAIRRTETAEERTNRMWKKLEDMVRGGSSGGENTPFGNHR